MSVEADIADIKADMRHIVELARRHEKTLYGEDGGNGLAWHVARHNEKEKDINRLVAAVVALLMANVGTLLKVVWNSIKGG